MQQSLPPEDIVGRQETADLCWNQAFTHLIKVSYYLIEQPETLNAHVVPVQLNVEVVEVGD